MQAFKKLILSQSEHSCSVKMLREQHEPGTKQTLGTWWWVRCCPLFKAIPPLWETDKSTLASPWLGKTPRGSGKHHVPRGSRRMEREAPLSAFCVRGETSEGVDFTFSFHSFFKALYNSDQDQQTVEPGRRDSNRSLAIY